MISYSATFQWHWFLRLSVLKSRFNPACSFVFKQLLSKSEKRFVRTHGFQEMLGLSEVLWVRTVLFVDQCEFRFPRFKKASRALANRAKAQLLDHKWQSPDRTAQCSNHWAKTTNLTYQSVNHCDYKVWLQKRIHNQKNMLNLSLIARQLWCWVPQRRLDLATLTKCVCKVLIYHPTKTQHFIMIWRCWSRSWMLSGSAPHKSENINTQERLILPPFVVGGLLIIHSIDANWTWRIHVIKPFQRLYRSKFFLPQIDLHLGFAHRQRISAGHQMFYGKWLGNHPFYPFLLKDLCARAFWASLSLQTLPLLISTSS